MYVYEICWESCVSLLCKFSEFAFTLEKLKCCHPFKPPKSKAVLARALTKKEPQICMLISNDFLKICFILVCSCVVLSVKTKTMMWVSEVSCVVCLLVSVK